MKKILAVSIILLFIGVAVAPSINQSVVKASTDDDLVEVTTQACGIKGYKDTTVKLTREQYQNLEEYLVDFRARLNQTSTRDEAIPIFKDAVVELDKYGLLPKGMSVERAQQLVTGLYQNTNLINHMEKLSNRFRDSLEGNALCLVCGKTSGPTYFQGPLLRSAYIVWYYFALIAFLICDILENYINLIDLIFLIVVVPHDLIVLASDFLSLIFKNSPHIGSTIFYGCSYTVPWEPYIEYYPNSGYIWTNGVFGEKNWTGNFYGKLHSPPLTKVKMPQGWAYFPGISGFIGLHLNFNYTDFFIGSALKVNVGPEQPFHNNFLFKTYQLKNQNA
jgi:hypothetical protein